MHFHCLFNWSYSSKSLDQAAEIKEKQNFKLCSSFSNRVAESMCEGPEAVSSPHFHHSVKGGDEPKQLGNPMHSIISIHKITRPYETCPSACWCCLALVIFTCLLTDETLSSWEWNITEESYAFRRVLNEATDRANGSSVPGFCTRVAWQGGIELNLWLCKMENLGLCVWCLLSLRSFSIITPA